MKNKECFYDWRSLLIELTENPLIANQEQKFFKDLHDKKDLISLADMKKVIEAYRDKIGFRDIDNTTIFIK